MGFIPSILDLLKQSASHLGGKKSCLCLGKKVQEGAFDDGAVAVAPIGSNNIPAHQHDLEKLTARWNDLNYEDEHCRLREAIVETVN